MNESSIHISEFPGWDQPGCRDELLLFLFCHFAPLVTACCRRHGLQPADAEDIMGELWVRVRPKFDGFLAQYRQPDRHRSFRTWLLTIVRNLIVDVFRRQQQSPLALPSEVVERDLPEAIATGMDSVYCGSDCLTEALIQARQSVAPHNWYAFWECAVHGRTVADVAREQGRDVNAVKAAIRRVRSLVRSLFDNCMCKGGA